MSTLVANSVLISCVVGYLLGSIPFGYLLVRLFRGEDVRKSGSGNIGATNVSRKSPLLGVFTLVLDALKGTLAVFVAYRFFLMTTHGFVDLRLYPMLSSAALFAVVGHMFPLWLQLRGGKGVATSVGAFAPLIPYPILGAVVVFLLITLIFRYVSLGSIAAAASLPLLTWFQFRGYYEDPLHRLIPIGIASLLVILRHHENIRRLLAGTENRLGSKPVVKSVEGSGEKTT